MTFSGTAIEILLKLATELTVDFFLILLPFKLFGSFAFELQNDIARQGIGQAKGHKVPSAFTFYMRKVSSLVNAGTQWVNVQAFRARCSQFMMRANKAGVV